MQFPPPRGMAPRLLEFIGRGNGLPSALPTNKLAQTNIKNQLEKMARKGINPFLECALIETGASVSRASYSTTFAMTITKTEALEGSNKHMLPPINIMC